MNPIKVTETELYKQGDTETTVCRGKLAFAPTESGTNRPPIIISETEKCQVGDWGYKGDYVRHFTEQVMETTSVEEMESYNKILARPENFHPKLLRLISHGEIKDIDEMLIECESQCGRHRTLTTNVDAPCKCTVPQIHQIKLTNNNYITLFVRTAEKEESWDDFFKSCNIYFQNTKVSDFIKENYNPPTRK